MSNLQIIEQLCAMLDMSLSIIRRQTDLLDQHGIKTYDGELEQRRTKLLSDIENAI